MCTEWKNWLRNQSCNTLNYQHRQWELKTLRITRCCSESHRNEPKGRPRAAQRRSFTSERHLREYFILQGWAYWINLLREMQRHKHSPSSSLSPLEAQSCLCINNWHPALVLLDEYCRHTSIWAPKENSDRLLNTFNLSITPSGRRKAGMPVCTAMAGAQTQMPHSCAPMCFKPERSG